MSFMQCCWALLSCSKTWSKSFAFIFIIKILFNKHLCNYPCKWQASSVFQTWTCNWLIFSPPVAVTRWHTVIASRCLWSINCELESGCWTALSPIGWLVDPWVSVWLQKFVTSGRTSIAALPQISGVVEKWVTFMLIILFNQILGPYARN